MWILRLTLILAVLAVGYALVLPLFATPCAWVAVAIGVYAWSRRKRRSSTHGSARWADPHADYPHLLAGGY